MPLLFEQGDAATTAQTEALRQFAVQVWRSYGDEDSYGEGHDGGADFQPFLSFDGNRVRARRSEEHTSELQSH